MDISGECGTFQGWSRACQWFTHLRSETQRKKMSRCAVVVRRLSVVHELTVHGPTENYQLLRQSRRSCQVVKEDSRRGPIVNCCNHVGKKKQRKKK